MKGGLYVINLEDGGRCEGWNGMNGEFMREIWDG